MRTGRVKAIFWGILLIATAAFIILSGMGYVETVDPIKFGFAAVFAGVIITSLIDLNFFGIFFPAALICIIFDAELGMEKLTPWPIIGIAVLLTIGFSLIFKTHRPGSHKNHQYSNIDRSSSDEYVNLTAKFNGINQYINSNNLKQVDVECQFGGVELYLDNAILSAEGAQINLNVSFGGVNIYVPKEWKVVNHARASFGSVEEKKRCCAMENAPTLYIVGDVKFGGVEIAYI